MAAESASYRHESAELHVTGEAVYIDDIAPPAGLLAGRVHYSPHARARIVSIDLDAARAVPGVHAVLCHRDIPGENQMGPVIPDEPCLAEGEVRCAGQAVVLIAAVDDETARRAEARLRIEYEPLEPILDIESAIRQKSLLGPGRTMRRGDPDDALRSSPRVIQGELRTGAQEHWYLESQACLCVPGEAGEITAFSSTQHPSETQAIIAEVLGIRKNNVVVEVRRLGGGFGGKETQANHVAAWAALLARASGRPVKIRLFRDDDMIITGKRHRYLIRYEAGFDDDGMIRAVNFEMNSDGGMASDLSFAIMERAMLHADSAYYIPHMGVTARVWKTNLPSNTAMRGFGAPQAMAAMETVIDRVARELGIDAADVRSRNFYGTGDRNVTHYGQTVENNRLHLLYDRLIASSGYGERRAAADAFNASHEFVKRGLALTPVKFGIAFTTTFLNKAGALVHIYRDGSILVSHGGIEMGQGLHTKIRQIAAREFGVDVATVRVGATNTSKVPNTSATAASSGADLNGAAVRDAARVLKARIAASLAAHFNSTAPGNGGGESAPGDIEFAGGRVFDGKRAGRSMPFGAVMELMLLRQVSLSAEGFYAVPGIGWDKEKGWGHPFNYYAFGMCVTEAEVDMLTGAHRLLRTDILYDAGDSLNPAVDIGQVEGGYVQGLGWCTTEEILWDEKGRLLTHSPDTYKIPAVRDIPEDFRVALLEGYANPNAIHGSKAVAEPPLMLALSAWLAIKDAVSAVGNHECEPDYQIPATNEIIVLAAARLRTLSSKAHA
ncbi:MAG TPA: xanthine dehydrogenase molybdopterin binding subunit [Bacteroidota bacterium]|nr:xanthine dehydrogenase molybdopterin binding subunit [Bacteroidota bacterium]